MLESTQLKTRPLFRALSLLWSRMGPARLYVLAGALLLFVLAALGVVHLLSSASRSAQAPLTKSPPATADATPVKDALIAITEIGSTEARGRNGQKNVAVKIGVAPRPNIPKGEVEIRVSFFDLTETNEMRPTEAEVKYEWLTPVRDWKDPTPKYLVATYEGARSSRKSAEKIRYGGFVVRVYFDGQLQAERSEPKGLVATLRSDAKPSASPATVAGSQTEIAVATPTPQVVQPRAPERETAQSPPAPAPVVPVQSPLNASRDASSAIPYASPVPDKPGFVYSPHNSKFIIDVRGFFVHVVGLHREPAFSARGGEGRKSHRHVTAGDLRFHFHLRHAGKIVAHLLHQLHAEFLMGHLAAAEL